MPAPATKAWGRIAVVLLVCFAPLIIVARFMGKRERPSVFTAYPTQAKGQGSVGHEESPSRSAPAPWYSIRSKGRDLAGPESVDCGWVTIGQDPSKATACALDANAKGKPFRIVYQVQGIDSIVAGGIVRTPEGKLLALEYDSCPAGCGYSETQQSTVVSSCPQPYRLYVNPKGRINCFQPQLSHPNNIMSPNMEPY